jgi:hypothetical protein
MVAQAASFGQSLSAQVCLVLGNAGITGSATNDAAPDLVPEWRPDKGPVHSNENLLVRIFT